jgi:hypothetical protein
VVVDLAVADEPDVAGRVGERLVSAVDVADRQPPVPEPRAVDANLALVVGSAVREAAEHALRRAGRALAVDGGDPAHQALSLVSAYACGRRSSR